MRHLLFVPTFFQLRLLFYFFSKFKGKRIVEVAPEGLTLLSEQAMIDISHLLRPGHLQQLRNILDDTDASDNDRYVAMTLLKNASVAAAMVLPGCQDTGLNTSLY